VNIRHDGSTKLKLNCSARGRFVDAGARGRSCAHVTPHSQRCVALHLARTSAANTLRQQVPHLSGVSRMKFLATLATPSAVQLEEMILVPVASCCSKGGAKDTVSSLSLLAKGSSRRSITAPSNCTRVEPQPLPLGAAPVPRHVQPSTSKRVAAAQRGGGAAAMARRRWQRRSRQCSDGGGTTATIATRQRRSSGVQFDTEKLTIQLVISNWLFFTSCLKLC
jgi:hypothetical protein